MKRLWIWNWQGGGYNSCHATSREDAIRQANEMAKGSCLRLNAATLHEGTIEELLILDREYASLFY